MAYRSQFDVCPYCGGYDRNCSHQHISSPISTVSMTFSSSSDSNQFPEPSTPLNLNYYQQQCVNPADLAFGSPTSERSMSFCDPMTGELMNGQVSPIEVPTNRKTAPSRSTGGAETTRFVCVWEGCESNFGRVTDLKRHYTSVHGTSKIECPHKWCGRVGKHGFSRKDHYMEHLREVHKQDIPKLSNRGRSNSSEGSAGSVSSRTYKPSEKSSSSKKGASAKPSREAHRQASSQAPRRHNGSSKTGNRRSATTS